MTVDLERLAFVLCPHLRGAEDCSRWECARCPPIVQTDYGPGTNLCRLQADAAARAAMAVIEEDEGR